MKLARPRWGGLAERSEVERRRPRWIRVCVPATIQDERGSVTSVIGRIAPAF